MESDARHLPRSTERGEGTSQRYLVVVVTDRPDAMELVGLGFDLAESFSASWHVVYVETPKSARADPGKDAAAAMAHALKLGATVAAMPAVDFIQGVIKPLRDQGATDLVLGRSPRGGCNPFRQDMLDTILVHYPDLRVHIIATQAERRARLDMLAWQAPTLGAASYAVTLGMVVVSGLAALIAGHWSGARGLDLFFLFPVIAAAVRFGLRQSLLAAMVSVVVHNLLFVPPISELNLKSGQSIFMMLGLAAVGLYTSALANQLRGRLDLTDRSAKENAAVVTFAQELARADNWSETAQIVCRAFSSLLDVRAAVIREKDGTLSTISADATPPRFGLLDDIARDWTWAHGEESGRGTTQMAAADWRFIPLRTALGNLALVAIARDDGDEPIPARKAVLCATLASLAALAHERLRLEDAAIEKAREGVR